MRINILQHSPNEGPGFIKDWALERGHDIYVYHPYYFDGILPNEKDTDMLIILGGPMSPNDDLPWIKDERKLIQELIDRSIPIFGACYGAQQISKTLGYDVSKAPYKEVGWAPVYLKSNSIQNIPPKLSALHWHEEMFEIPKEAELLFSSDLLENQGFLLKNIIGLQFHFEPTKTDIHEIVVNDASYALNNNALNQSPKDILTNDFPSENKETMFKLLDYISK